MERFIQVGDYARILPLSGVIGKDIYVITSINQQPSVITITIESLNSSSEFRTLIIGFEGTKIQGSQVENEIIYGTNQEELEQISTTRDIGVNERKFRLTGVELVDINILAQMDDDDLISACKIDRYTNQLCQKDALWKQKISMKYPGAIDFKDNTTNTWKDYYFRLTWIDLDQEGVNEAAINGYLDILSWIESLPDKIYPDQRGLTLSAENGHVKVLQWLADRNIHTTNNHPLKGSAMTGKIKVLKWYVSLSPPHQKYPDRSVFDDSMRLGSVNILKWIITLPPPHNIYPDQNGVDEALFNRAIGSSEALEWVSNLPPPHNLLPHRNGLTTSIQTGDINMLKWAASHGIYPSRNMISHAGRTGQFDVYIWASTLPAPHTVYIISSSAAAKKGRLDFVKWAASLPKEHRRYPSQHAIEKAQELGHNDIIEWLSTQPGPSGEYARKLLE